MKVVLFCGGRGLRMREGTERLPKPMVAIGDRPLIWHVMRYYAHFGHTEFILCLGYGAAILRDYFLHSPEVAGWTVSLVDTGVDATIGERLLQVRPWLENDEMFLANYSDTLTDAPLDTMIAGFRHSAATVSMLVVRPTSTHHVVDFDDTGHVTEMRSAGELTHWVNGGYFVMRRGIFDVLRPGEEMVPQAFARLTSQGRLLARPHQGFWRAADTVKDRAELEAMYQDGQRPWMLWDSHRGTALTRTGPMPLPDVVPAG